MLFLSFSIPLKLCTKIIEKNANPEWNQVIHLQVKVRMSDDVVLFNECIEMSMNMWYETEVRICDRFKKKMLCII